MALALTGWQSFYVMVGSSAAALTGLTFVVITLSAEGHDGMGSATSQLIGLRVFITPTAVHFGAALWLSALLCIPGQTAVSLAVLLAATGLCGLIYCIILLVRLSAPSFAYTPFLSDWIWNVLFPIGTYLALAVTGAMLPYHTAASLYAVSGAALLLLFIGIHNAWDVVVWITTERHARKERQHRGGDHPKAGSQ